MIFWKKRKKSGALKNQEHDYQVFLIWVCCLQQQNCHNPKKNSVWTYTQQTLLQRTFNTRKVYHRRLSIYIYIWMFPKIVGFPPKSSILIGVFHYKPSILGCFPIFGNIHIYQLLRLFHECHFEPSALPGEPWQKFDARSHKTEPPFYLELKQPKLEIGDNTMGKSTCNL